MMLRERIKRVINKEALKTGKMGAESVTVSLTLTDRERAEFFTTDDFSNEHYNWELDLEENKLTITYTEDLCESIKRFEIIKNTCEISKRSEITEGCTLKPENQWPETIESFNSKTKASEALKKYKGEVLELSGGAGTYYAVKEYYIEENIYDEFEYRVSGREVWEFAENPDLKKYAQESMQL